MRYDARDAATPCNTDNAISQSRITMDVVGEEKSHMKHIRSVCERPLPSAPIVELFCSSNIQQCDLVDGIR